MSHTVKIVWALIAVISLLLLGLLATRVGGIAIRSVGTQTDDVVLSLSNPVVRGVPIIVHWEVRDTTAGAGPTGMLLWRDSDGEHELGPVTIAAQSGEVVFSCTTARAEGSVVLVDAASRAKLGSLAISLLPPGAECVDG